MQEDNLNFSHQADIFNPQNARGVTIVGVGAVGSYTALAFAKVGVTDLTVIDYDSVASHNEPMSLYGPKHVGFFKVDMLKEIVYQLAGVTIKTECRKYADEALSTSAIISCVDDMEVRKAIRNATAESFAVDIFCDSRVAAAYVEILAARPRVDDDLERYDALHCTNEEAVQPTCGNHGIVYASMFAAQTVVANVCRFWETGVYTWRVAQRCDTLFRVF